MSVLVIELPGDPVPKERPRLLRAGRAYTPPKTRAYEDALRLCARAARGRQKILAGAVTMRVTVTLKIPTYYKAAMRQAAINGIVWPIIGSTINGDLDNYVKAAKDALNGVIYNDDSQICELVARKQFGELPGLRIEIAPLEPEHAGAVFRELAGETVGDTIGKAA